MRTSLLSRSVVAVATLGISSVALAAVPASAASPSGVTRQQVLSVLDMFRAGTAGDFDDLEDLENIQDSVAGIVSAACGVQIDPESNDSFLRDARPILGKRVEGLLITAFVDHDPDDETNAEEPCTFGVLATSDDNATLVGEATIGYTPDPPEDDDQSDRAAPAEIPAPLTSTLSGDVFTSPVLNHTADGQSIYRSVTFTANGTTTTTTSETTTTTTTVAKKVWDKKSTSEKRSAKKKYVKRLKAAKATYQRALGRANGDATKKAAARQAYRTQRAAFATSYKYATWNYRYVKRPATTSATRTGTDSRPFSVKSRTIPSPT